MDTTAKVDIRKLQLLNDRIAQTIDALNQVRLSVHGLGLSHSSAGIPGVPFGVPYPTSPYQAYSAYSPAYAYSPMYGAAAAWPTAGISHSSPWATSSPWASSSAWASPQAASYAQQVGAVNPVLSQLLWQQGIGGLSHSDAWGSSVYSPSYAAAFGAAAIDPFTANRIMHMFPFAQMPVSPV
jgi:hypothetical protein